MQFNSEKNGYSRQEVDKYIDSLRCEYERITGEQKIRISDQKREIDVLINELKNYKTKNSNISDALVVAVETAKQIELSSKNVYDLEIKRVRALYTRWENFLNDLMKKYPELEEKYDKKKLLEEFSKSIDAVIEKNGVDTTLENESKSIGLRNLITKMGGLTTKNVVQIKRNNIEQPSVKAQKAAQDELFESSKENGLNDVEENNSFETRVSNFENKIKPISKIKMDTQDNFESLVDKFLNDDTETSQENAFSKEIIRKKQESGFDLKEALNPTEDLLEILKDFDFYDDNGDKN